MTRPILLCITTLLVTLVLALGLSQFEHLGRASAQTAMGSGSDSKTVIIPPMDAGSAVTPAPAPTKPAVVLDPENPTGVAGTFYNFVKAGEALPAIGAALILLVWFLRTYVLGWVAWFKTKLGGYAMTFGTSVLLYFGSALAAAAAFSFALLLKALGAGLAAAGGWEVVKDLFSKQPAIA